jgi:hypothetical protein
MNQLYFGFEPLGIDFWGKKIKLSKKKQKFSRLTRTNKSSKFVSFINLYRMHSLQHIRLQVENKNP